MVVRAFINKETLKYLREHIGITLPYIEKITKYNETKYLQWEDVNSCDFPTCLQAKKIAKCFRIPFAGLYMNAKDIKLQHIPKMYNMRTIRGNESFDDSSLNLAIMDLLYSRELLISTKNELQESLSTFSFSIVGTDVKQWADSIREIFKLELKEQYLLPSKRKFYLYIRNKIEKQGVFIQGFSGVDTEIARGVAIYNDLYPIIGINNDDRYPAKTFSIIHELVHIFKRQSTMCNDMVTSFSAQQEEVFCNAVAGEVLVPEQAIKTLVRNHKIKDFTEDNIASLADVFCVSKEVISRRLLDIGKISQTEYDTFILEFKRTFDMEKEIEREKRKASGNNGFRNITRETIDKTSGSLFQTLYHGYGEGLVDRQDIARYLRIDQKHISNILREVSQWSN